MQEIDLPHTEFHTDQIRINDRYVTLTSGMSLEKSLLYGSRDGRIQAFTSNNIALLNPMTGFAVLEPEKVFTDGELRLRKDYSLKLLGGAHYVAWYGKQIKRGIKANFCIQTDLDYISLRKIITNMGLRDIILTCTGSTLPKSNR